MNEVSVEKDVDVGSITLLEHLTSATRLPLVTLASVVNETCVVYRLKDVYVTSVRQSTFDDKLSEDAQLKFGEIELTTINGKGVTGQFSYIVPPRQSKAWRGIVDQTALKDDDALTLDKDTLRSVEESDD